MADQNQIVFDLGGLESNILREGVREYAPLFGLYPEAALTEPTDRHMYIF